HVKQFHQIIQAGSLIEDTSSESYFLGKTLGTDLEVGGGKKFLVQRWSDGTKCDLTGNPRRVEIQFHCNPQNYISVVTEMYTCNYLVVIHTSYLCAHPAFHDTSFSKIYPIECRPVVPDAYYQRAIEKGLESGLKDKSRLVAIANKLLDQEYLRDLARRPELQSAEIGFNDDNTNQDDDREIKFFLYDDDYGKKASSNFDKNLKNLLISNFKKMGFFNANNNEKVLFEEQKKDNAGEIDEENQFVDNNETLTLEMMKKELDYFNIEMSMKELNLAEKAAAEIFTKFIKAIENLIYEAIRTFSSSITIEFFKDNAGEIDEENQFVDNNETLTLEMMKKELDYFNIEMSMKELNLAEKAAAEIFTKFIKAIENLIYEAIRTFSSSITIEFFSSSKSPSIQFNDTPMKDKLLEYKFIGYGILDHFDESYLSDCLTRSFPFMDVYLETEIKYNSYNNSLFLYT
ncbi:15524_t:CDS:2, partial [Entrophospora sp. SA101]